MIPGFSTGLGWEREWESYMANSKEWRSEKVNAIELNCNVVKNVATPLPISTSTPPTFSGLYPLSSKKFRTPFQVTQFMEGPTTPSPFNKGRFPTMTIQLLIRVITSNGTTTEQYFKTLSLVEFILLIWWFSNLIIEAKGTRWRISGIDKINCKID